LVAKLDGFLGRLGLLETPRAAMDGNERSWISQDDDVSISSAENARRFVNRVSRGDVAIAERNIPSGKVTWIDESDEIS